MRTGSKQEIRRGVHPLIWVDPVEAPTKEELEAPTVEKLEAPAVLEELEAPVALRVILDLAEKRLFPPFQKLAFSASIQIA